jgi:glycine cleavage system aminomethyltransferase T
VLTADGKEVGHVTRTALSPALQTAIGMAYVRRENAPAGSELLNGAAKAVVITPLLVSARR